VPRWPELKKVERRLLTTVRSMTRVIIMGTTLSGKRRMLKSESDVKALAAVSWPLSAAYMTKVTAVTMSGVAVKMNMKSEE